MYISCNLLSSSIPTSPIRLLELNVSHNYLTGPLPTDIGNMEAIDKIDVSANRLSGSLPLSLGELVMLTILDMSNNSFQGVIPESFSKLTNIQLLDLSLNELSGSIPNSLSNLTQLTSLNLSFNRLEGRIPAGGIFSWNITRQSLMGNSALCGLPALGFPPCPNKDKKHSRSKIWLLELIVPAVAACGIIVITLYLVIKRKMEKKREMPIRSDGVEVINHRIVSYHELARATDNFSESNLLGAGSYSKVFKGRLDDGLVVAIKVLYMESEGAFKSFDAECHALRMARHRNLTKILSTCSNLDFKALILPYMPNGSLENLLSSGQHLGFIRRVNIMLDVAMAMEYMHHDHMEVVLHCDLKPSNVLLDEDMTAYVADFGIARMMQSNDTSIVSVSLPGTLGYMAPEYGATGRASRKSDVFSYGIVLFQVFSRRRPMDPMFEGELSLREWVSRAFPSRIADVVDRELLKDDAVASSQLQHSNDAIKHLLHIVELGLICSNDSPDDRISMSEVVVKLNKIKKDYLKCHGSNT